MSNAALLERPTARRAHLTAVTPPRRPQVVTTPASSTPTRPAPAQSAPASLPQQTDADRNLPVGTSPRGFALYVGFDESKAAASGVSLGVLVEALRRTLGELAPEAETHATVALAPAGAGGRDVDVVRLALHEPTAIARHRPEDEPEEREEGGVVVDISRKKVFIDGDSASFTYKEFELLQYLVLREGSTIDRSELVSSLWSATDDDAPGERTIDVHVRRLRAKLGRYEDIVRTVRGIGYRFDRHADVVIRYGHGTPSPDRF